MVSFQYCFLWTIWARGGEGIRQEVPNVVVHEVRDVVVAAAA